MMHEELVQRVIRGDSYRWHLLGLVRTLELPDCWVGGGFVRNAIWDHLHGKICSPVATDVDVIWFDLEQLDQAKDSEHETLLRRLEPNVDWDVKNQARMHLRNGDGQYTSTTDALKFWTDTATSIAVRRRADDTLEVAAPYGLEDLINLTLRPTPRFVHEKVAVYRERILAKRWLEHWPMLHEDIKFTD